VRVRTFQVFADRLHRHLDTASGLRSAVNAFFLFSPSICTLKFTIIPLSIPLLAFFAVQGGSGYVRSFMLATNTTVDITQ